MAARTMSEARDTDVQLDEREANRGHAHGHTFGLAVCKGSIIGEFLF